MESLTDYTRFTIALMAILDPFAAVPIYLSLTGGENTKATRFAAVSAAATCFAVLVVAAFSGELVLAALGTSLDAFRVGGGIVLLLMAIAMLGAQTSPLSRTQEEVNEAAQRASIGVVPIALPLLAGPGAISTTIIQMERGTGWAHAVLVVLCIAVVCSSVWIVLRLASPIGARLGVIGLNILNRLFGLLLAAIAVQIMANGLTGLFPGLLGTV